MKTEQFPSVSTETANRRGKPAQRSVPLLIERVIATAGPQPVTVGVPLPRGALAAAHAVRLVPAAGAEVAVQTRPLALWADGSVRWLLLDFLLPAAEARNEEWQLELDADPPIRPQTDGIGLSETAAGFRVTTGPLTFEVGRSALPWGRISLRGVEIGSPAATRFRLSDARGRVQALQVKTVTVEESGPVRCTLRFEGNWSGRGPLRFVGRISFFAGSGLVCLSCTLHNPRRARHRGGLWDLGDPGSVLFRDLTLEVGLSGLTPGSLCWIPEPGQPRRQQQGGRLEIYQDSSGGPNWNSRNHVDRDGRVSCVFRGYRERAAGSERQGLRASPVVTLQGPGGGVTVAVPEFWQNFPKALEVEETALQLRLFPGQCGSLFELQGGEQKTHICWFEFAPVPGPERLAWVHDPALVRCPTAWYAESGCFPYLVPEPRATGPLDELLGPALDGEASLFARREVIDEYGWRNYGDVYADHEAEYYQGPQPVISHYNNQYDLVLGMMLQFLRTGRREWWQLAAPLARHVIDIDIYHTDGDKAAYNGGLFWFTDHYKDAATSTHRTYSRRNYRPGDHSCGGGPGSSHNFTTGLLHYYYLTGDPGARDAVLSLADWVVNMDDGRRTVLGLLDPGPTGLATPGCTAGYHGPDRGAGNSVNALLDGWLLCGRPAYLAKAEELIRRVVHPDDDVAARDLLNVEKHWSYTVFLKALARYLRLKVEAGQVDRMYAYARASLLTYARWMLEYEVPYFDQIDRLEYPTEAWAGQEFRKANVLRLAAASADEPLRSRLLRRGAEFAERAWSDLGRFASRRSARALALVLAEGCMDEYFRCFTEAPLPEPPSSEFEPPRPFVGQKERIRHQLRSPAGIIRLLRNLVRF